jgi:hypothetical protein
MAACKAGFAAGRIRKKKIVELNQQGISGIKKSLHDKSFIFFAM